MLFALVAVMLLAGGARAYVDPGAGMQVIGPFLGLVGFIAAAVGGVLLWPIYALIRLVRGGSSKAPAAEATPLEAAAPHAEQATAAADAGPPPPA
jgi:hypothetical protein